MSKFKNAKTRRLKKKADERRAYRARKKLRDAAAEKPVMDTEENLPNVPLKNPGFASSQF